MALALALALGHLVGHPVGQPLEIHASDRRRQVGHIPAVPTIGRRCTQRPRLGTRVCRSFGAPMRELVFCPQYAMALALALGHLVGHPVESGFGRQIFTPIRQAWHDLAWRQVTQFRCVRHRQTIDPLPFA